MRRPIAASALAVACGIGLAPAVAPLGFTAVNDSSGITFRHAASKTSVSVVKYIAVPLRHS
jgi:hypothetical protein